MSSHHIVRENQEPALFIADIDSISEEYLNQLLEWSPTLITTAEQYPILKSREIKVDVVLDNEGLASDILEENLIRIPYSGSYITSLFSYLKEKNNYAVTLILDSISEAEYLPYLADFVIILLKGNRKSFFVKKYEKWLPQGYTLRIAHLANEISSLLNLAQLSDQEFQVKQDGFISIPEQQDYLFISEDI